MFRRVVLAAALSLVMAVFAGHGSFGGGAVHAAGIGPGSGSIDTGYSCDTTYSASYTGSSSLYGCDVGENDGPVLDNDDDTPPTQNEVGTASYSGSGCIAASITTGEEYYNPTSYVEFDTYNSLAYTETIRTRCTVQTGDASGVNGATAVPTHNLLAYAYDTYCDYQLDDDSVYGSQSNPWENVQIYETETTTGVVTLYCNASFYVL